MALGFSFNISGSSPEPNPLRHDSAQQMVGVNSKKLPWNTLYWKIPGFLLVLLSFSGPHKDSFRLHGPKICLFYFFKFQIRQPNNNATQNFTTPPPPVFGAPICGRESQRQNRFSPRPFRAPQVLSVEERERVPLAQVRIRSYNDQGAGHRIPCARFLMKCDVRTTGRKIYEVNIQIRLSCFHVFGKK